MIIINEIIFTMSVKHKQFLLINSTYFWNSLKRKQARFAAERCHYDLWSKLYSSRIYLSVLLIFHNFAIFVLDLFLLWLPSERNIIRKFLQPFQGVETWMKCKYTYIFLIIFLMIVVFCICAWNADYMLNKNKTYTKYIYFLTTKLPHSTTTLHASLK